MKKQRQEPKERLLIRCTSVVQRHSFLLFFSVNFVGSVAVLLLSHVGLGYPIYSLYSDSSFSDFTNAIWLSQYFFSNEIISQAPDFSYAMTPAFVPFFKLFLNSTSVLLWFTAITGLSLLIIFLLLSQTVKSQFGWYILISLTSFPVIFCYLRGGADLILTALVATFLLLYLKQRKIASAVILGVVIALKPHFAWYAMFFIRDKNWLSIFYLATSSVLTTLFSLLTNGHGKIDQQLGVLLTISKNYSNTYNVGDGGLLWDSSLFGLTKSVRYLLGTNPGDFSTLEGSQLQVSLHYPVIITISVLLFWFSFVYKPDNIDLLLIASCAVVLLPPVSAIYKLTIFLPVVMILLKLNYMREVILILVLWIPKSFIWIKFLNGTEFTLDSIVNPIILFFLLFLAIYRTLRRGSDSRIIQRNRLQKFW